MQIIQCLLFVLKGSHICYYIISMAVLLESENAKLTYLILDLNGIINSKHFLVLISQAYHKLSEIRLS